MEADGEQTPINASAATPPSLRRTWFIALVADLVNKIVGRETQPSEAGSDSDDGGADIPELEPDQARNRSDIKSTKIGPAALKAGGRRRKASRK